MSLEILSTLRGVAFCEGLQLPQLEQLAATARPVQWAAGETVFREGEVDGFLHLIVSGRVGLEVSVPRRGRVRILTVGPGEPLGWSSVYYQKPKTATATALEPTRALAIDAARLRALGDAEPGFGYWLARRLLQVVSDRLRAVRLQMLDVFAAG